MFSKRAKNHKMLALTRHILFILSKFSLFMGKWPTRETFSHGKVGKKKGWGPGGVKWGKEKRFLARILTGGCGGLGREFFVLRFSKISDFTSILANIKAGGQLCLPHVE